MKLLVTGGHPAPALACIDTFRRLDTGNQLSLVYVGSKYISGSHEETFEYQEIKRRAIPFFNLEAGRLTRTFTLRSISNIIKIPSGLVQGLRIINSIEPDVVLSFGGYTALPIALAAYLKAIPIYTHEQTIHPGFANRIIAGYAQKVFISFVESKKNLPKSNTIYTGNPVRESIHTVNEVFKKTLPSLHPIIFITGGSLGSHSINILVSQILPQLLEKYSVIHQVGNVKEYSDYDMLMRLKEKLSPHLAKRYYITKHIPSDKIGTIYAACDLVIGRSGANTFFDLISVKKPALFIPLPWAAYNEQYEHAMIFKNAGTGELFNQQKPAAELYQCIVRMINTLDSYRAHFNILEHHDHGNAASLIYKEIIG